MIQSGVIVFLDRMNWRLSKFSLSMPYKKQSVNRIKQVSFHGCKCTSMKIRMKLLEW